MKKALQPQRVPQPQMVVAVPSLTPEYALWNTATGEVKRVYGGNSCENSVYVDGIMPKLFRMAAEDGSYEHEQIFAPLPDNIEEVVLAESPECKLLITSYQLLPAPEVKQEPVKMGKVIKHPAVFAHPAQQKTATVLPLFPDYPTSKQQIA